MCPLICTATVMYRIIYVQMFMENKEEQMLR